MLFRDPDQALRAALWRRFAVMDGNEPRRCTGPRNDFNKIVFETSIRACGAAAELAKLGSARMFPHPCKTGGVKHWHLTRSPQKEHPCPTN